MKIKVVVIFGTRPEVIKLVSVILALKKKPEIFECIVCSTGQHRKMVDDAMASFDLSVDIQLDAMANAFNLANLTSILFLDIDKVLEKYSPKYVIVQGDTTSAFVGAMCAFYRNISIGHVEAGLRTYNMWSPFPEEINRSFISKIANLHFCPTALSKSNLIKEGLNYESIHITGNTVVDALELIKPQLEKTIPDILIDLKDFFYTHRIILLTTHRRESFDGGIENICKAIKKIVDHHQDVGIVFPVHLNPKVRNTVNSFLGDNSRIKLIEPVDYLTMLYLLRESYLILSDSGGIQEEAPSFKKPLLILRENSERPEVIDVGCAKLVGTDIEKIFIETSELLKNESKYLDMTRDSNPFGDGQASKRIIEILEKANC